MTCNDAQNARDLVERALDLLEERGRAAVDELLAAHPDQAAEVRARLDALDRTGLLRPEATHAVPERLGEFRLLETLGEGGMGVVYRARQESLDRVVALKVLRPEQAAFGRARERFRREVETVARLQHPGIVPVYAVGDQDGVSWFAMECIAGCSLARVIRQLQGRAVRGLTGGDVREAVEVASPGGADPSAADSAAVFDGTFEEVALRIAACVADALQHAHGRGILHRDVKPSNIMLTPDGRVQLVDFGVSGSTASDGPDRMTRSGARLGTLSYMSPEQLRGDFDDLDARTDVYSLGLTLHELLTLEPAFSGTPDTIVRDVAEGRRPPVRSANPGVSWETETILIAATDTDRVRRYRTAADLQADLEAVLEHRPIRARRPPWTIRLRRWSQRRPGRAVALAAAVLAVIVGPSVLAVRERASRVREQDLRRRAELALAESERQRSRAERNLDDARGALRLVTDIAAEGDLQVSGMQRHRVRILRSVLAFHEQLYAQREGDPEMRLEAAVAAAAAGGICASLGDVDAMRAHLTAAVETLRALAAERPDDRRVALELAQTLRRFGKASALSNDPLAGIPLLTEALRRGRDLHARRPDHATRWHLGQTLLGLALARRAAGRKEKALEALEEAVPIIEQLEAGCTEHPHGEQLAQALVERSLLIASAGESTRALADLAKATGILETLAARDPGDEEPRNALVVAHTDRGLLLGRLGRWEEARASHESSVRVGRRLVRESPLVPAYRANLGANLNNLAQALARLGRRDESDDCLAEAREVLERVIADHPDNAGARLTLFVTLFRIAEAELGRGDTERAEELFERARAEVDLGLRKNPGHAGWLARRFAASRALVTIGRRRLDHERMVAMALEAAGVDGAGAAETLYAVRVVGDAINLARRDEDLDEEERRALCDGYAAAALDVLEACEHLTVAHLDELAEAPEVVRLRERPRFAPIMKKLRGRAAR